VQETHTVTVAFDYVGTSRYQQLNYTSFSIHDIAKSWHVTCDDAILIGANLDEQIHNVVESNARSRGMRMKQMVVSLIVAALFDYHNKRCYIASFNCIDARPHR
jgi:hypothetical protein